MLYMRELRMRRFIRKAVHTSSKEKNMESVENTTEISNDATSNQRSTPRTRVYTKYVLPSERHPFSVHYDVVRRFISLSKNGAEAVGARQVEGAGIPVQSASMNVRFMRSVGLLAVKGRRGRYIPTPEAIRFVNALSVSKDRARPILRGLLSDMWFTELVRTLLSQRPVMSEDQLVGELALAAQTDRVRKGDALRVIVDYLVDAAILKHDEQGLSLATSPSVAAEGETQVQSGAADLSATVTVGDEWHTLQTEDFVLRVRSDPEVIEELEEHLGLLKKKVYRLQEERSREPQEEESR